MKLRKLWWKLTVGAGVAGLLLTFASTSCVMDENDLVPCSTGVVCPEHWLCAEPCDLGDGPLPEALGEEDCAQIARLGCYVAACGGGCYPAGCGDGRTDRARGERCDDGNTVSGDGCSATCLLLETCGDGVLDKGEECDDGNSVDGDECTNDCQPRKSCGNGVIDPGEVCDHGVGGEQRDTESCDADCTVPQCGDGHRNPQFVNPRTGRPEACDKGGVNTKTCDADCTEPECGDGHLNRDTETPEECDDGNGDNKDACLSNCNLASCGDGSIHAGVELCDDGNAATDDACPSGEPKDERLLCQPARCGDGFTRKNEGEQKFEDCDEFGLNTKDCDSDCTSVACGDGHRNAAADEECDDGNGVMDDACVLCKHARCGDGRLHRGVEQCDLREDAPTCDGDCTFPVCGDDYRNLAAGEQCDTGIESATCNHGDTRPDAVNKNCKLPSCGDGYVNRAAGEECEDNSDCNGGGHCIGAGEPQECKCS